MNLAGNGEKRDGDDDVDDAALRGDNGDTLLQHPYIGKRVRVLKGQFKGIEARITGTKIRGWWMLDHPEAVGKVVHCKACLLLDVISDDVMTAYFSTRMRDCCIPDQLRKHHERYIDPATWERSRYTSTHSGIGRALRGNTSWRKRRRPSSGRQRPPLPHPAGLRRHVSVPVDDPHISLRVSDIVETESTGQSAWIDSALPERFIGADQNSSRPRNERMLPPVLLDLAQSRPIVPATSHLDPDLELDVFDRSIGKILSGSSAVTVRDLPAVLLAHAAYEPIVPPLNEARASKPSLLDVDETTGSSTPTVREGRSGGRLRVAATVRPQNSLMLDCTDRFVRVREGRYRGTIGKVEQQLPGGSFLLRRVGSQTSRAGIVVNRSQLEVLSEPVEKSPLPSRIEQSKPETRLPDENETDLVNIFQSHLRDLMHAAMEPSDLAEAGS